MHIEEIIARDPRYRPEAYAFLQQALHYTQKLLGRQGHVSGQQLCEGCRRFALKLYGRLAKTVLNSWGLYTTDDFGNVVYNLIGAGVMSKTEEDSINDFHAVFDFEDLTRDYRFPRPRLSPRHTKER